jgi:hypothetical protein
MLAFLTGQKKAQEFLEDSLVVPDEHYSLLGCVSSHTQLRPEWNRLLCR